MNKILKKIKEFIYKHFGKKELPMLEETEQIEEKEDIEKIEEIIQSEYKNNKFRDYLDVKEYQEILTMQDRYENQEISEEELSIIDVMMFNPIDRIHNMLHSILGDY